MPRYLTTVNTVSNQTIWSATGLRTNVCNLFVFRLSIYFFLRKDQCVRVSSRVDQMAISRAYFQSLCPGGYEFVSGILKQTTRRLGRNKRRALCRKTCPYFTPL